MIPGLRRCVLYPAHPTVRVLSKSFQPTEPYIRSTPSHSPHARDARTHEPTQVCKRAVLGNAYAERGVYALAHNSVAQLQCRTAYDIPHTTWTTQCAAYNIQCIIQCAASQHTVCHAQHAMGQVQLKPSSASEQTAHIVEQIKVRGVAWRGVVAGRCGVAMR